MEMYEGGMERFRTCGMSDTPRIKEMIDYAFAFCVSRAFVVFVLIAKSLNQEELSVALMTEKSVFEKTAAFKNIF